MTDYPSRAPGQLTFPDNIGIWVCGNVSYGGLSELIDTSVSAIRNDIERLYDKMNRYSTKTVRGKEYWYLWDDGAWKYCGRNDPRDDIKAEISALEKKTLSTKKKIKSCVIRECGNHLLIDIDKFSELPCVSNMSDILMLRDLADYPSGSCQAGELTDNSHCVGVVD